MINFQMETISLRLELAAADKARMDLSAMVNHLKAELLAAKKVVDAVRCFTLGWETITAFGKVTNFGTAAERDLIYALFLYDEETKDQS